MKSSAFWRNLGQVMCELDNRFDNLHFSVKTRDPIVTLKVTVRQSHDKMYAIRYDFNHEMLTPWHKATQTIIRRIEDGAK